MNILIVAATWPEVKLIADELTFIEEPTHLLKRYRFENLDIDILIAGIGVPYTVFHLTNALRERNYELIINAGIAGSLCKDLVIGEVVSVISEEFADLGIEKESEFLTLFEAGFMDSGEFPFDHGVLKATEMSNELLPVKNVRGITTNKSHGRIATIAEIKSKFSAQVESMEGAAVFYVCKWMGIDCWEIRAISNYVGPRDTASWNIPLALEKLKESVIALLRNLTN